MVTESGSERKLRRLRVLGVPGSLSERSLNLALLRAAQALAPDFMDISIFDLNAIPLYNADLDDQPMGVKAFKTAIRESDAVLFATPEYNHGMPGVLKNAIDWASWPSAESPLRQKPAAIIGASAGQWGTVRAQMQLRSVLAATGMLVIYKPEVLVSCSKDKFDTQWRLVDETARKFLTMQLHTLADWVERVRA